jgi:hypothetical protein
MLNMIPCGAHLEKHDKVACESVSQLGGNMVPRLALNLAVVEDDVDRQE